MLGDMRRDRYDSVFHSHDRTGGKEDRPHHRNLSIFRIHKRLVCGHVYDGQRPGGMGMARISRKRMGMNYPYTVYYVDMRGIRQICLNVEKYIQACPKSFSFMSAPLAVCEHSKDFDEHRKD